MKKMFDKLTSDNSFRFINPSLIQRSRRVKEPQFDVKCLSSRDTKKVLQELDCLLRENEEYEDFVRSTRYRELRVIVANTVWAMNDSFVSNVHDTNSADSSLTGISRWKLRFRRSLGSPVDSKMIVMENSKAPSGILRERAPETLPIHGRPDLSVRFSSAASMVIFPVNNTPRSTSETTLAKEGGIMGSLSKTAEAFSTFISEEKSNDQGLVEEELLSSYDIASSPSNVDVGSVKGENIVYSQKGNTDTLNTETSASFKAPVDRNSDTRQNITHHETQLFTADVGDMKFSKCSKTVEKQNTSKRRLFKCLERTCCLQVVIKRKFANFFDKDESVSSLSAEVDTQDYTHGISSDNYEKLSRARDSLSVIQIPKCTIKSDV